MDGEHRIGDSAWPENTLGKPRTSKQAPGQVPNQVPNQTAAGLGSGAAGAGGGATATYPGSFKGNDRSAASGQGFPDAPARSGGESDATQLYDGRPGPGTSGSPVWPGGPVRPGGPPPTAPAARSGSDTVAFEAATRSAQDGYGPGSGYEPGGYGSAGRPGAPGQDRFNPVDPARRNSGGPSRSVVFTSLGVAALLAIGTGAVYSMTRQNNVDTALTPTASPSMASPSSASALSLATATTPSVTVTVTTTARATGTSGAPGSYVEEPWSDPDMKFGTIVAVKRQGDKAQITVRRQHFLTGEMAQEYYDEHPDKEQMDYAITDDGGKNKQYTVAEDALVYGANLLGDGPTSHTRLTVSEFTTKAKALLDDHTPLRMWMRRRSSSSHTVIYLAEQYIP